MAWWLLPCGISHHGHNITNISNVHHGHNITNISNVPLKKLLSHTATKGELTVFLWKELLTFSKSNNNLYTVAWQTKPTHHIGVYTISTILKKKLTQSWYSLLLIQVKMMQQKSNIFLLNTRLICSLPKKIPRFLKWDYFCDRNRE